MPRGLENALIEFLTHLFQTVGWPGVFLGMTIESAAIPLPSEVIMPLAGWLLIQARGNPVGYVVIAGIVGALGCVTGSLITYYIGAFGGRPLLLRYGKYIFLNEHHIDLADKWFAEKGEITAFVSRLLPIVRTFISVPAGIARMNVLRFVIYTFLGSFLWCVVLATGGYYAGSHWEDLRNKMRPFDYPIAAIVVVILVFFVIRGRRSTRGQAHADAAEPVMVAAAPEPVAYQAPIPVTCPTSPDATQATSLGFYRPQREEVQNAPIPPGVPTANPTVSAPPPAAPVPPAVVPPPPISEQAAAPIPPPPTARPVPPASRQPSRVNTEDRRVSNDDAFSWFGGQDPRNGKKPQ